MNDTTCMWSRSLDVIILTVDKVLMRKSDNDDRSILRLAVAAIGNWKGLLFRGAWTSKGLLLPRGV